MESQGSLNGEERGMQKRVRDETSGPRSERHHVAGSEGRKKRGSGLSPQASRKEHRPADIFIFAQEEPGQTSDLWKWEIINLGCLSC